MQQPRQVNSEVLMLPKQGLVEGLLFYSTAQ